MGKMSLIELDLKPIADVANNLINKVSEAVGWIATRDTLEKDAIQTYIKEIENSNLSPIEKAALLSKANVTIKQYINTHDVLKIAVDNLESTNKAEDVDNDWITQFMDLAKNVSNHEFQLLWGNLLASECNNPGSIPKSVMFILQKMDKEDADCFMKLSSIVVNVCGEYAPLVFDDFYALDKEGPYRKLKLEYDDLCQLETLGLIKMEHGIFAGGLMIDVRYDSKYKSEIVYFGNMMKIKDGLRTVEGGSVMFTKDGKALYNAVKPEELDGFWSEIIEKQYSKYNAGKE